LPIFYVCAGSFFVAVSLIFLNVDHDVRWRFICLVIAAWSGIFIIYYLFKLVYTRAVSRLELGKFWQKDFFNRLDELFFVAALSFLSLFIKFQSDATIYFIATLILLFARLNAYLGCHPRALMWQKINLAVGAMTVFIFGVSAVLQFVAFKLYIFDARFYSHGVVILRAYSITMFWLLGFSLAGLIFLYFKKITRMVLLVLWSLLFAGILFLGLTNIGILYFSGLHFSPVVWQHASGAGGVIWNWLTLVLVAALVVLVVVFVFILHYFVQTLLLASRYYWRLYLLLVACLSIIFLIGSSALTTTPEFIIVKSFYDYYLKHDDGTPQIRPEILAKLKRFGLNFDISSFNVAHKNQVFSASQKLLPDKLLVSKPNIVIVFLESFSARLTDVYNSGFKELTPGLDKMAADKNTTIFKKYFNASTPTITGLISQLCSFLPPTGNQEIEVDKRIKRMELLCLPKILRSNGWQYSSYITAVEKEFSNKDTLLTGLGIDEVFGTAELAKYISGEPLSWGYSDHQMLPAMFEMMKKQKQPFLYSISTVDTHAPYTNAKDKVVYPLASNKVLDAIHTTDDAFKIFWEQFKQSEFANNTIVVAVADHAIFPSAYNLVKVPNNNEWRTFYDENTFMMYVPDSVLPKTVDMYSSGLDFTPTILHILNINTPNSFEGYSIFDPKGRILYPNLMGMHEFGLYTNEVNKNGTRTSIYQPPDQVKCPADFDNAPIDKNAPLTACEFLQFYRWERTMFEQGRFWETGK